MIGTAFLALRQEKSPSGRTGAREQPEALPMGSLLLALLLVRKTPGLTREAAIGADGTGVAASTLPVIYVLGPYMRASFPEAFELCPVSPMFCA